MSIENRINPSTMGVWDDENAAKEWHEHLKNQDLTDYVISVGVLSSLVYQFQCYHKSTPDCKLIIGFEC